MIGGLGSSREVCGQKRGFGAFWGFKIQVVSTFRGGDVQTISLYSPWGIRILVQTPLNDATEWDG